MVHVVLGFHGSRIEIIKVCDSWEVAEVVKDVHNEKGFYEKCWIECHSVIENY